MSIEVLIVEDEAEIARLVSRFLAHSGLVVDVATDGEAGVRKFFDGHYDVVLIDGLLPKRNGFAVADAIRGTPRGHEVGLIMMSAAFRSGGARREAYQHGFDAFFAKPFVVSELHSEVLRLAEERAGKKPPSSEETRRARLKVTLAAREAERAVEKPSPRAPPSARRAAPLRERSAPAVEPAEGPPAGDADATDADREDRPITGAESAPFALLAAARAGRSGLLRFAQGAGVLEVAFLRGVPVGAWDNLHENRIGERLVRQGLLTEADLSAIDARMRARGERFAEAAVGLGRLDEEDALRALDQQAADRLCRAITWSAGTTRFEPDEGAVERMLNTPLDLVEHILRAFLGFPDPGLVEALRARLEDKPLVPTRDFEAGLVAFAKLRPASSLPGQFLAGPRRLSEVLAAVPGAGTEVVAMRMAGLLRAPGDPLGRRPIPHDLRVPETGEALDTEGIRTVRAALLRARGRSYYALLEVSRAASPDELRAAFERASASFGREALDLARLGPAREAAREVWARLDDAEGVLLDDERRATYDADLAAAKGAPPAATPSEQAFLKGRLALSEKRYGPARQAFAEAVHGAPGNADYVAFLGWATILEGLAPPERGLAILQSAHELNPQAMRPAFFLGLAAARVGEREKAVELLTRAARRAPDDRDVLAALEALEALQREPASAGGGQGRPGR